MAWSPAEGLEAAINFEGELFETEDQRNWLDASYKTYCTPLSIPFPVAVNVGDEVNQSLQLQVNSHGRKSIVSAQTINLHVGQGKTVSFSKAWNPVIP